MILRAVDEGQHTVIAQPTGAGKTVLFTAAIRACVHHGLRVAVYVVRNTLFDQLRLVLEAEGIHVGTVASQFKQYSDGTAPVQLCMLQTVSAAMKRGRPVPRADVVIIDEAHQQKLDTATSVFSQHKDAGAVLIGLSATPAGVESIYDRCIQSVHKSQLRSPNIDPAVLLPSFFYGPSEIDVSGLKQRADGEYSKSDILKRMPKAIFGHVIEEHLRLNPSLRPSILFAPDVASSKWFADQYNQRGITAVHVDGDDVYEDGMAYASEPDRRRRVIQRLRDGDVRVICNRFVFREGIDIPELYHLVLACPIGSLVSYEQVVGRVLRACGDMDHVIIQDHGGNWWRHGSANMDRDWEAMWGTSPATITKLRHDRIREGKEEVGISCEQCGAIRLWGSECHACGHRSVKSVRRVWQSSGKLRAMEGSPLPVRTCELRDDTERVWLACLHRCKHTGRTYEQARGLFVHENFYWPPKTLRMMPKRDIDWYATIGTVEPGELW